MLKDQSLNAYAYWEKQFKDNGRIWGNKSSASTEIAMPLFVKYGVRNVLIPGVGYGRNSIPFSRWGFNVTGVEISSTACRLAEAYNPRLKIINGSIYDLKLSVEEYDAVFCFDVLHLFLKDERRKFLTRCGELVKSGGLLFFTVLSEKDNYFGCGTEVEPSTFEVKPGKFIHFFSQSDLRLAFQKFKRLEDGHITDLVEHEEHGQKQYEIRYICVEK